MRSLTVVLAMVTAAFGLPAGAANLPYSLGGTQYNVAMQSMTELRYQNVVRQQFDLSCGAAAMATLLKHFYDRDISEAEIIEEMIAIGDTEEISKRGFSMLELKRFVESRGFVSEGFRIEDVGALTELKVPVITLIDSRGYKHFVVLKDIVGGKVIIADPAFGNSVKSLGEFEDVWNKVILVVLSKSLDGNAQFVEDLSLKARPGEISLLLQRGLQSVTGGRGEF